MLVKCRRNSNEFLTEPPAESKEILGIPHPDCFEEKFRESLIDCIRCCVRTRLLPDALSVQLSPFSPIKLAEISRLSIFCLFVSN